MVPEISVTVLAFKAFFVSVDPNWKMALRLSLTFAGSNSPSSARAAKPQAIMMATSANPNKRRIFAGPLEKLLHLTEAPLRLGRTELDSPLVPGASQLKVGNDVARILRSEHGGIVGLCQHQCGGGLLRVRCALEQQPRRRNVARGKQPLGPRHQRG